MGGQREDPGLWGPRMLPRRLHAHRQQGKMGKWGKNDWWEHKREDSKKHKEELAAVKRFEEECMQEALGLKPKNLLLLKTQPTPEQLKDLFKKEDPAEHERQEAIGLGFGPSRQTVEVDQLQ